MKLMPFAPDFVPLFQHFWVCACALIGLSMTYPCLYSDNWTEYQASRKVLLYQMMMCWSRSPNPPVNIIQHNETDAEAVWPGLYSRAETPLRWLQPVSLLLRTFLLEGLSVQNCITQKKFYDTITNTNYCLTKCARYFDVIGYHGNVGGAVASWLVRSTPDRVVRVRVLAGDIVLCSWARHFTLTVPLSTQVYKWVPA